MKTVNKYIRLICLLFLHLTSFYMKGQETDISYQIIFESKLDYQKADRSSSINPDNYLNIKDFSSLSQLFPVLKFEYRKENIKTLLQTEANIRNYNFDKDSTDLSFQELFLQLSLRDRHFLVFGKKRLDWGSGMIWNPTNFHIQKDPLRTQNRLEGIFVVNYAWLFENNVLQLYIFPEKEIEDFSYTIKYDVAGYRVDMSLSYLQYKTRSQIEYDFSYGGDKFTAYSEGVLRNFTKSYKPEENLIGVLPHIKGNHFYTEWVGGGSFLLNNHFTLRAEYRYRSDYLNKYEVKQVKLQKPANMLIYDALSISRNSLFGSLDYLDTYDRWSLSVRTFYDPVSHQLVISPLGVWKKNNFQAELSAMIFNNYLPLYDIQTSLLISYYF